MVERRGEIEAFLRRIVAEIAAAEAAGRTAPDDIAAHLNARGLTSRKGRRWTGSTLVKFLASPGARRHRGGGPPRRG